jgi:hypothetical protein
MTPIRKYDALSKIHGELFSHRHNYIDECRKALTALVERVASELRFPKDQWKFDDELMRDAEKAHRFEHVGGHFWLNSNQQVLCHVRFFITSLNAPIHHVGLMFYASRHDGLIKVRIGDTKGTPIDLPRDPQSYGGPVLEPVLAEVCKHIESALHELLDVADSPGRSHAPGVSPALLT